MTRSFVDPNLKVLEDNLSREESLRIINLNYYRLDDKKIDKREEDALVEFWLRQRGDLEYFKSNGNWLMCGYHYKNGRGVEKDYNEAYKCYREAEKRGSVQAIVELGICYTRGRGVGLNEYEALKCFQSAESKGSVEAIVNIGRCYWHGRCVPKSYYKAYTCYRDAESKGSIEAIVEIGLCYKHGNGVGKDFDIELSCYLDAESKGSVEAIVKLGDRETLVTLPNSYNYYRDAASKESKFACYTLGWYHLGGHYLYHTGHPEPLSNDKIAFGYFMRGGFIGSINEMLTEKAKIYRIEWYHNILVDRMEKKISLLESENEKLREEVETGDSGRYNH